MSEKTLKTIEDALDHYYAYTSLSKFIKPFDQRKLLAEIKQALSEVEEQSFNI